MDLTCDEICFAADFALSIRNAVQSTGFTPVASPSASLFAPMHSLSYPATPILVMRHFLPRTHVPLWHSFMQVKKYFNSAGFERWRKIYGETNEVNKVQLDIRTGHAQTVEKVVRWVDDEGGVAGVTVCDAGCGTGAYSMGATKME